MKLAGIAGKGTGKLGSMVFASAAGEQVVRQYQPSVSNPNTKAQVNNRAKLKLMSQVAAAVSGEIAIPRQGLKSSRNLFVKKNYDLATASDGVATLDYASLQFTNSSVALPGVNLFRRSGVSSTITAALYEIPAVSRVVYLCYKKTTEGALQFVDSQIATEADGAGGFFSVEFDDPSVDVVVYAYGMRDMSAKASAKYGNYSVTDGTALASLIMNRTLSASDYQFTATSGATLFESQDSTETQGLVSISFGVRTKSGYYRRVVQDGGSQALTGVLEIKDISATPAVPVKRWSTMTLTFTPTTGDPVVFDSLYGGSEGTSIAVIGATYDLAKFQGVAGTWKLTIEGEDYTMAVIA